MQVELLEETWVETPLLTTAGCKRIHEIKSKQCFDVKKKEISKTEQSIPRCTLCMVASSLTFLKPR